MSRSRHRVLIVGFLILASAVVGVWLGFLQTERPSDAPLDRRSAAGRDVLEVVDQQDVALPRVAPPATALASILVLDEDAGVPRAGARVDLAPSCEELVLGEGRGATTDENGVATLDAASIPSWMLVSAPGYQARVVHPEDALWEGLDGSGSRIEVGLCRSPELQLLVQDHRGRPVSGVQVRAFARWGNEALALATEQDAPCLQAPWLDEARTDQQGRCQLAIPQDFEFLTLEHPHHRPLFHHRHRLDGWESGRPQTVTISRLFVSAVAPDPPNHFSCSMNPPSGLQLYGGEWRGDADLEALRSLMEQRTGLEDVVWLFYYEDTPTREARPSCGIHYNVGWDQEWFEGEVVAAPLAEWRGTDLLVPESREHPPLDARLRVHVPEGWEGYDWWVWTEGWAFGLSPDGLPREDRPAAGAKHGWYTFRLAAGRHRVVGGSETHACGLYFEPLDVELDAGQVLEVDLAERPLASTLVHFDVQDTSGRRISHHRVRMEFDRSALYLGRLCARPLEQARVKHGRYEAECFAIGYQPVKQQVELVQGEQWIRFVLPPLGAAPATR